MGWANPQAKRAAGRRAVANWDEDSVTMAVEACRNAFGDSDACATALWFASTTQPFADRSNAGVVSAALGFGDELATMDVTGSLRAATSALHQIFQATGEGNTLVVAADLRKTRPGSSAELHVGDGSASVIVGNGATIADFVASSSHAVDFVDHYRSADQDLDYNLEDRWIRDEGYSKLVPNTVAPMLAAQGLAGADVDRFILPAPWRVAKRVAAGLSIPERAVVSDLIEDCGHAGCAQPLLQLCAALERAGPGEWIVLCGFGQGVDSILLKTTPRVSDLTKHGGGLSANLAASVSDNNYIRYLANRGLIDVDWGMRAERDNRTAMPTFYRKRDAVTAFIGGRCQECGTVQFPRSSVCVNPECRAFKTQEPFRFANLTARIKTFTEDWQGFTPDPPLKYGNVEFFAGGNLLMEFTDCEPGELDVGLSVRMQFRIKDFDSRRAFRRYFWKATLLREGTH